MASNTCHICDIFSHDFNHVIVSAYFFCRWQYQKHAWWFAHSLVSAAGMENFIGSGGICWAFLNLPESGLSLTEHWQCSCKRVNFAYVKERVIKLLDRNTACSEQVLNLFLHLVPNMIPAITKSRVYVIPKVVCIDYLDSAFLQFHLK